VHVRVSPYDDRIVDIRFMDKRGLNHDKNTERNVERVFFREDFRRVYQNQIGVIDYPAQVASKYMADLMAALDVEAIKRGKFYLVVDYGGGPAAEVLPKILAEMGCQEVALNAHPDESKMAISSEELQRSIQQLATICSAIKSNLGVRLDVAGERIFVVDNQGRILRGTATLAAMAAMALRAAGGGTIAVPVTQPRLIEKIAEQYGGKVLRTKSDLYDLMSAATKESVIMAGDGAGNFIFPQFQPAVDGLMAVVKTLEFLATQNTNLSDVIAALPPYYTAMRKVSCPWEHKGTVMRLLNEQFQDYAIDRTDGFKIYLGDEWVLVLPDPDNPFFQVFTEGASASAAEALADKYVRIVESLQR
jgi:mannose-1-phosphate guanylyltransferase / phosphomannomutase